MMHGIARRSLMAWLLAPFALAAQVVVNEVQSSNSSTCYDEDGAASDWVELYNTGTEAVDLGGWGLSDKASKPFKWTFPEDCQIGPGEHLRVFASGKDRRGTVLRTEPPESARDNLVMWLRGDDALDQYGAGGAVVRWSDAGAFGNDGTQSGSYAPTVLADAVNGHAAVSFAASSSQMLYLPRSSFNGMTSLSNVTVFVVCSWGGRVTSGIFGQWQEASSTANAHFEIQSGGALRWRLGNVDFSVASAVPKDSWTCLVAQTDSARETPRSLLMRDGAVLATKDGSVGETSFALADRFYVGNSCGIPTGSPRPFDGAIAEVAVFNRALTLDECAQMNDYLSQKYLPGVSRVGLHTSYSLSASGETLVLTRPDGTTEDEVEFGAIPCDTSWGRSPDGADAFGWFDTPTPVAANPSTCFGEPLAPVVFSRERGVYDAPLELSLSHPDPAATIVYTLDRSEPSATNGVVYRGETIAISHTTAVRATAVKASALPCRQIATHTYLFLADAAVNPGIPYGFPSVWSANGASPASYGVSANVIRTPDDAAALTAALQSVPILAVTLSDDALFGSAHGIYTKPLVDGLEAAASCEWFRTDGTGRCQIDAGLRAQGAASRNFGSQPKKSLRLCFRGKYGASSLEEPVLDASGYEGADFNSLVLRAEYNNSWTHSDAAQRTRGAFVRDQFVRDTFTEMGGGAVHGSHVHLFLNGFYWGLYNITERPDDALAAQLYGGEREDWDVIKGSAEMGDEVRDGDAAAWKEMIARSKKDLTVAANWNALVEMVDASNLADYMLLNFWVGNNDWPGHNWVAVRPRTEGGLFRFLAWDAERTLEGVSDNRLSAADGTGPGPLHQRMLANETYRNLVRVRAGYHLSSIGALDPSVTVPRYRALCDAVEPAIFGEVARWGAYRMETGAGSSIYGLDTWHAERDRILENYLPARTDAFAAQLTAKGLEPIPPSDACQYLRFAAVMSCTRDAGGDGAEFIVLTNLSPRVALDLGGIRVTLTKDGDDESASKCAFTLPSGLTLAPGASLRLEKADCWGGSKQKITNGRVNGRLYDADGGLCQRIFFSTDWSGFAETDGHGGFFVARTFGPVATEPFDWRAGFVGPRPTVVILR